MQLTREEIENIARFLSIEAEPECADLAVLFGGRFAAPAYLGVDLFDRGVVDCIAVTGGANRHTGINEAHAHRDILIEKGVPPERVIVEDRSTNTLENVLFLLPKLRAVFDLSRVESLVAVTKWYHCRRAVMTLKAHLPGGIRYYTGTFEPDGASRADWHRSEEGRRRVLKEWRVIPEYLQKGDIAEIQRGDGAYI